jgi:hypothetical protein
MVLFSKPKGKFWTKEEISKMRGSSWTLSVLVLFAAIVVPTAAKATTYQIDQLLPGGGSIVGSITTNGSTGTLGYIDIYSWSFGASDGTNRGTSTPGAGAGRIGLGDINVTPTNMIFNFSVANGGDLIFPVTNDNGNSGPSYIEWVAAQCPICGEIAAVNIGGDGMTDALTGITSSYVIGSVAPTPEPSSLGLMIAGIVLVLVMRKRIAHGFSPTV